MALIKSGTFVMGSPANETGRQADEAQRTAKIEQDFMIGVAELDQRLWEQVMGTNPTAERCSTHRGVSLVGPELPIVCVSWHETIDFLNRLSVNSKLHPAYTVNGSEVTWDKTSDGFRLPTEGEWEFAARAGLSTKYVCTDLDSEVCTYGNVGDITAKAKWPHWTNTASCSDRFVALAPVGTYPPNRWGLVDMAGNVREWVWDSRKPTEGATSSLRGTRGGAWDAPITVARPASRDARSPDTASSNDVGFRVARTVFPKL